MALPADCNTSSCSGKITKKHKGICPTDWHIPSNEDWNVLMKFINSRCSDDRMCDGAGTKLKATIGWNSSNDVPSGTDDFGFSALPGGSGGSGGGFTIAGDSGDWWSSTEYDANYAYYRYILYYHEDVYRLDGYKGDLQSVRCLQD